MTSYTSTNPPTTDPNSSTVTSQQSIPSHPAPADAAAVSSGVPTDASTGTTTAPSSSEGRRDSAAAKHAQEHAQGWKPNLDRRQSWSKEDQKRALQMSGIQDDRA